MAQPNFRTNKPQDVADGWGSVMHVTYSGKCVICGVRCYAGMGSAYLEHSDSALVASEYGMTGEDVMMCFMCGNDGGKYARAITVAYSKWVDEDVSEAELSMHNYT